MLLDHFAVPVDIDREKRLALAGFLGAPELSVELVLEEPAASQASECVAVGRVERSLLEQRLWHPFTRHCFASSCLALCWEASSAASWTVWRFRFDG